MTRSYTDGRRCGWLWAMAWTVVALSTSLAAAQHGRGSLDRTADVLDELANDLRGVESSQITELAELEAAHHHRHDAAFYPRDEAKEELGKFLFWDKLLSGNKDISCATCHHSLAATGDGLSLPVGQGGVGLGVTRSAMGVHERVPRNAPHVFNLGAVEFKTMFHDGRVQAHSDGSFTSPAGDALLDGLENALAVQAMFPVTSPAEMAGNPTDTPIADAAALGDLPVVWELLAQRLRDNSEYVGLFMGAFDDIAGADDITFAHAANAIAAYEAAAFRADDSPFDRWLSGDRAAMSKDAQRGMRVFYGSARCGTCHSGRFQTNHDFKAVAMPQIGPGKGDNLPGYHDGLDDFGRERVTGDTDDRFRFRVPSLRNVAITGPWGHDGAYNTLEVMVRHQLNPVAELQDYDTSQVVLPENPTLPDDLACHEDSIRRAAIADACELGPRHLNDRRVADLVEFLHALTDSRSLDMRSTVPMRVPSGLPVYD